MDESRFAKQAAKILDQYLSELFSESDAYIARRVFGKLSNDKRILMGDPDLGDYQAVWRVMTRLRELGWLMIDHKATKQLISKKGGRPPTVFKVGHSAYSRIRERAHRLRLVYEVCRDGGLSGLDDLLADVEEEESEEWGVYIHDAREK